MAIATAPKKTSQMSARPRINMWHRSFAFGLICAAFAAASATAQSVSDQDTTIRTTIVIRSKASECPPDFTIFLMDSGKKLPRAPKICFVRTSKSPNHTP